jgi:heme-degrading monooxygenase HmoA
MIVRVYRCTASQSRETEVANALRETTPVIRAADGCLRVEAGRRLVAQTEEFVVVSLWRDLAAIQAFTAVSGRGSVDEPFFPDRMVGLIEATMVEHFEGIETQ